MTSSSSSSSSDRVIKSSRDEASRFDYAKLYDSRKRTQNSTRNLTRNLDDKSIENLTENDINYL